MTDANLPEPIPSGGQILIYRDGSLNLQVRLDGQTAWLTQAGMAELFQTTPQNITLHIRNIYGDGEQSEQSTCKEYLQVRRERERQVQRALKHYNLDLILAVGYRVRSPRGTQFRQRATAPKTRPAANTPPVRSRPCAPLSGICPTFGPSVPGNGLPTRAINCSPSARINMSSITSASRRG